LKLFLFILSTLLLIQSLQASEPYMQIVIAKTSHKSNLKSIKHKLDAIHIKMYVKKQNASYFIYSQKFAKKKSAYLAFKKIKRYFKYAKLLYKKEGQDGGAKNKNKFSLNFSLGIESLSGSSGLSYTLEPVYRYNKDVFMTLAYQTASSSSLSINNFSFSGNYIYRLNNYSDVYGGALLGYSQLEKSGFTQSNSITLGMQTGYRYELYDYLRLFTQYQMVYMDHIIKLNNNNELKFNFMHNLQIGVSYIF